MARLVKLIGTGLNGSGMARGPKMQVTAVISAMIVICLVLIFLFLLGIAVSIYFSSEVAKLISTFPPVVRRHKSFLIL